MEGGFHKLRGYHRRKASQGFARCVERPKKKKKKKNTDFRGDTAPGMEGGNKEKKTGPPLGPHLDPERWGGLVKIRDRRTDEEENGEGGVWGGTVFRAVLVQEEPLITKKKKRQGPVGEASTPGLTGGAEKLLPSHHCESKGGVWLGVRGPRARNGGRWDRLCEPRPKKNRRSRPRLNQPVKLTSGFFENIYKKKKKKKRRDPARIKVTSTGGGEGGGGGNSTSGRVTSWQT